MSAPPINVKIRIPRHKKSADKICKQSNMLCSKKVEQIQPLENMFQMPSKLNALQMNVYNQYTFKTKIAVKPIC